VQPRHEPRALHLRDSAIFLLWPLIIAAFVAQLVFSASFTWERAFYTALRDWLPWIVLSPFVWWLARRFPLERGALRWSLPVHLAGCALAVALTGWMTELTVGRRPPLGPGGSPRDEIRRLEREGMPPPSFDNNPRPGPPRGFGSRGGPPPRYFFAGWFWARTKFDLPVYWIIVSAAHALAFYRRAEDRQRKALELTASLSRAKLEALRLQLQPHFLFNTLNAISTLVHSNPDGADEMISTLSDLLRLSLDVTDQEIPLRRELEILDRYLEIEQVRLGDRLRVVRLITPEALDARVPSLLLQPIVENAVRHGIEPRLAPGTITVRAARQGGALLLIVSDDGLGLKTADTRTDRRGIAHANPEAPLGELYGGAARLVLREPPEGGVSVEIEIPFRSPTQNAL
jgi:hypothetical protein